MAIVVEGEKKKNGIIQIIVAVVSLSVLLFAMYYVFFSPAPFVEIIAPPELENISQFSKVNFNPEVVEQSEIFQSLRSHVSDPELGEFGRENPFARF